MELKANESQKQEEMEKSLDHLKQASSRYENERLAGLCGRRCYICNLHLNT